uniref:Transcription initiation factor TFIID subunit 9 n=2 Tax=Rhodnius prolixus TaxID=13249 RepID=T1HLJ8_RHOPR
MANQTKQCPKDGLVIISMLKELGISNYEPRVVNQLLEFATRYVSCVLDDARAFANHSKKKTIDVDDIKLAVGMQMEKVFTTPPPRDLLLEVARSKNSVPLPIVKPHCGIRLPPDRHCFSACNYKLKTNTKKGPEKV